jgi:hypothetical protein
MRQNPRAVAEQRRTVLADRAAHALVLVADLVRLGQQLPRGLR